MSSFDRTASPVLTMPLPSAHQISLDGPFFQHQSGPFGQSTAWGPPVSEPPIAMLRGRKRSRDEAAVNLDAREKAPPIVEPVKEAEDEWVYGPGMTLIKKSTGYVHDASHQSGTWLDEKAAKDEERRKEEALLAQQIQAQERPSLRSHKSSRLDLSASLPPQVSPTDRSSPARASSSPERSTQPIVDDFTLHLGIGWSRVSEDEHVQAAARGWAQYIENHFPVTNPQIRLESRGLESYLVEAREGFFLFAENLRQGRLVSQDSQRALQNLKASPPVFDGPETLHATESPKPNETEPILNHTAAADTEMAMN